MPQYTLLLLQKHGWQKNNINVLQCPACSPDLNPIENLWGLIVKKLYRKNGEIIKYSSKKSLKVAITGIWNNIDTQLLRNLVPSMPSRCLDAVKKIGSKIDY